jgi:Methyltransferase domain
MEHYHYKIPGWFTFPLLYSNMVDLAKDGAHFVEVGSWMGASAAYMGVEIANSGKKIAFDCVDEWTDYVVDGLFMKKLPEKPGDFVYNLFKENTACVQNYVNPIRLTSGEAVYMYSNESLDFVFIDANHVYEAVMMDIDSWKRKIKPGGYIAGHDYKDEDVRRAVNDTFGEGNYLFDWKENCWLYKLP